MVHATLWATIFRLAQASNASSRFARALHPNSGIELRIRRQVFQIVGKVRQLMQKYVGENDAPRS